MRVVVIGAGIAGLAAARELHAVGVHVRVIERGRSVGGRMATRRIGSATLDHGAQFFTVRTPDFARRVDDWRARGLVTVWSDGFGDRDGHPRYMARGGMTALAKDLADALDVETDTMAFAVRPGGPETAWRVVIDDGTHRDADAVIVTCPLPQAFALLVDSGLDVADTLFRVDYDRALTLLVRLDAAPSVPEPGGMQDPDDVFGFVAENRAKGISKTPALTLHANPRWSDEHWDADPDTTRLALESAAARWLGSAHIVQSQVKRWRFARPRTVWPDPCWVSDDGTVVIAGDAFGGPRVEGAHNSGLTAAHALSD